MTELFPRVGKGKVKIAVATSGYGGKTLSKTIQVYTSDPIKKIIPLKVTGAVEKTVVISPGVVRLTGKAQSEISAVIRVISHGEISLYHQRYFRKK